MHTYVVNYIVVDCEKMNIELCFVVYILCTVGGKICRLNSKFVLLGGGGGYRLNGRIFHLETLILWEYNPRSH